MPYHTIPTYHTNTLMPTYRYQHPTLPYQHTIRQYWCQNTTIIIQIPPCHTTVLYHRVSYTENIPHTGIHGYTRSTEGQSDWSRRWCYHGNKIKTTTPEFILVTLFPESHVLWRVCVYVCMCICMIFVFIISCVCCCWCWHCCYLCCCCCCMLMLLLLLLSLLLLLLAAAPAAIHDHVI